MTDGRSSDSPVRRGRGLKPFTRLAGVGLFAATVCAPSLFHSPALHAGPRLPRASDPAGVARPAKALKTTGPNGERVRGQAMFLGEVPLKARIRGHSTPLPAEVVVCANCHGASDRRLAVPGGAPGAAPRVDRALLLESRTRRGGPSSTYDAASFCNLLRTGIDPVFILVAREMPTYEIDEAGCRALWRYLTEELPPATNGGTAPPTVPRQ
ncbi:MAG: hypothetical protein ABIS92_15005 [Polyangia bacterium]